MINAIAYSPRNPSTSLRFIDQADVRVPTIEEIRARKARLYGKSDGYEYRVPKLTVVDFSHGNTDDGYIEKIKCGIVAPPPVEASVFYREVPITGKVLRIPLRPRPAPRLVVPSDETLSILIRVAIEHNIPVAYLKGASHMRHVVMARRHAVWALATERPKLSYSAIGRALNKDHTTVLYALKCYARDNNLPVLVR